MKIFYTFHFTCLTFCLQCIVASSFTQGVWIQKSDFGGVARSIAVSFSIGSKGYVGTGQSSGSLTKDFWEYDPSTDSWSQKADFGGGPTSNGVGFSIGSKGYIMPGSSSIQLWEYDPSSNLWSQKSNYGGSGQSSGVGFSIGGKGYLAGTGCGECWEYDPSIDTWTQKANSDTSCRSYAVGFSIGMKGYMGTGLSGSEDKNDFYEYDPSVNLWTKKTDFAGAPRLFAVGFSIGGKGYIGTGCDISWNNFQDFWEYDPTTDVWIQVSSIGNGGTTTSTGFSIGGKGYIACGPIPEITGYSKTVWEFYPGIVINVTHSGNICNNQCNGSATATVTLGNPPYTYLWNTTPQQTTATATGLCSGTYSVTVTDSVASIVGSVTINTLPGPATVPICMVTVDSLSQNNIIIWDKTPYAGLIDSFFIYREIATNNYQPLGAVPFDSLSLFVDTVRTQYFPNSGNPNAGTYRYKIIVRDTCGSYSALNAYHNTIFITNNNGNFFWSQPYTVENSSNPVSAYILMRDDFRTGNWHAVNSVSGTQQGITDPDYASWQATARWRVETQWNISCTPTKSPVTYSSSFSNIYENFSFQEINENQKTIAFSIIPNPTNGIFTIHSSERISSIDVLNTLGKKIFSSQISFNREVNLSHQPQGIYFVEMICGEERRTKKIIIK